MIPKRVLRALSIVAGPLLIAVAGSAIAEMLAHVRKQRYPCGV